MSPTGKKKKPKRSPPAPSLKQKPMAGAKTPGRELGLALLIALAAFTVYLGALKNGFVNDDHALIENNLMVTPAAAAPELPTNNIGAQKWRADSGNFDGASWADTVLPTKAPRGMAFSPGGKLLFGANFGSGAGAGNGSNLTILDHALPDSP